MKVLVLGDTHGSTGAVRQALRFARDRGCEALVSVGDFGVWPGPDGAAFLNEVKQTAASQGVPVFVVPGNHDDYDQIHAAEQDADGWHVLNEHVRCAPRPHLWEWAGVTWLGFGGAASTDGPAGIWPQVRGPKAQIHRDGEGVRDLGLWWEEERITPQQVQAAVAEVERIREDGGRVSVMVTHDAPQRLALAGNEDFPLGEEQRARIQQVVDAAAPDVLLAGHWHIHTRQWLRTPLGVTDVVVLASADQAGLPHRAIIELRDGVPSVEVIEATRPPSRFKNP